MHVCVVCIVHCVYVCLCVHMHVGVGTLGGQKRAADCWSWSCKQSDMGIENSALALCNCSKHLSISSPYWSLLFQDFLLSGLINNCFPQFFNIHPLWH